MIYNIKRGLIMSREDILNNKFEVIAYENYRDADNMNRFILEVPQNKFSFFERLFKSGRKDTFLLKDNIFYVAYEEEAYCFKLNKDFENFIEEMIENDIPIFNISFTFPHNDNIYDFVFIGEM